MDTLIVAVLALVIIIGLGIQLSLANARMDGFREAQQRMSREFCYGNPDGGNGCIQALAVVGLIAICVLSAYIGGVLR